MKQSGFFEAALHLKKLLDEQKKRQTSVNDSKYTINTTRPTSIFTNRDK